MITLFVGRVKIMSEKITTERGLIGHGWSNTFCTWNQGLNQEIENKYQYFYFKDIFQYLCCCIIVCNDKKINLWYQTMLWFTRWTWFFLVPPSLLSFTKELNTLPSGSQETTRVRWSIGNNLSWSLWLAAAQCPAATLTHIHLPFWFVSLADPAGSLPEKKQPHCSLQCHTATYSGKLLLQCSFYSILPEMRWF